MKTCFIFFMVFVLSTCFIFGQAGQVGAIKGKTLTTDGTALPGVGVTLTSPDMVLDKMVTVSNQSGIYRFNALAPGEYTIIYEADGMDTIVRKGIVVSANMTVTVDIQMQLKTVEEQIIVEGKAPTIDRVSVAKTTTLDTEFLNSMPASRNFSDYFSMTPGVTLNNDGHTSSQGSGVRDNSFSLDGIQMNDPVVGTAGTGFGMDIMEEISVQTSGLSAEHGSVKGAVVNIVTKKGGNKLSGTANIYYNHESLQSDNTTGTPLEGSSSGARYDFEPGATLGGPIVKDRLWFFLSMSVREMATYVPGFPHDKEENVPNKENRLYPYAKLTFQPNQNDKFVLGFSYSNRKLDNRYAAWYNNEDTTNKYESPTLVYSFHWTHNFGDSMMTNLKIGGYRTDLNWRAKVPDSFMGDDATGLEYNSAGWDDLNPRWRLQAFFDGTLFVDDFLGSHELKFGIQSNLLNGQRQIATYGPTDSMGFSEYKRWYWNGELYYSQYAAGHDRVVRSLNVGIFLNDTWNITRNLTLNLGLRFDYNKNYFPAQDGSIGDIPSSGDFGFVGYPDATWDLKIDEDITAFTWKNFSPRIGLIYDLFSDGTTLLKANYSRYLQDNYTTISFALHPVNWVGYGGYVSPDGSFESIEYTWIPGTDTEVGYKDYGLKTPYTTEVSLGIERELWEDWSVGLRYVRRWDKNLIEDVDGTTLDIDTLMETGELIWNRYEPVQVTDPYDGGTITFWNRLWYETSHYYMLNPPGAERNYKGFELRINKRYSNNWSLFLSYVYNKSTGLIGNTFWDSEGRGGLYDNPNYHVNALGRMPMERRHQFKVQALVKGPLGINFSGYYRFLSGMPHNRLVRSIDLGDFLNTDQEIMAEPRGSYLMPNESILDFRVEKAFKFGNRLSLRLFCDIFNVFNSGNAVEVEEYSSNPNWNFAEMTKIQNPRVFRFGAKVEF